MANGCPFWGFQWTLGLIILQFSIGLSVVLGASQQILSDAHSGSNAILDSSLKNEDLLVNWGYCRPGDPALWEPSPSHPIVLL